MKITLRIPEHPVFNINERGEYVCEGEIEGEEFREALREIGLGMIVIIFVLVVLLVVVSSR